MLFSIIEFFPVQGPHQGTNSPSISSGERILIKNDRNFNRRLFGPAKADILRLNLECILWFKIAFFAILVDFSKERFIYLYNGVCNLNILGN